MRSFFCFILLLFSIAIEAQQLDEIDKLIAKQVNDQKITGLSIGIIVNGKIVMAKGYGLANVEHKIPASENTVYKIGSLSKQVVATAVMTLVQSGKIKLTDNVTNYFKDAPASWAGITIRHLLNHTSGLVRESPAFQPMQVQHDTVLIKAAYKLPLVFPTGTRWQYCNLGYFMLADIIRQVSGKPFTQFMQEEIFSKYGLSATQLTSSKMIVPHRAGGYVLAGKDSLYNATDYIALRPSGAFLSSITDMLKWELLMQNGQLLSKQNWQQMWRDTVRTGVDSPGIVYYGYGWNVSNFKSHLFVNHGGSLPGFRSIYYRFPADKTAVIILTNSDHTNAGVIAQGIAEILYKQ
jgi:CubicO group peptidase (beta-lactamase class C family)